MAGMNPVDVNLLYNIHVSFLPEKARYQMRILDVPTALCHGFRFLADWLGYTIDQICVRIN